MFRKDALVLTKLLNTDSKLSSVPSMHRSTIPNSFEIWDRSLLLVAPLWINFETMDHLVGLDFEIGTHKNNSNGWRIEALTALTSRSTLITAKRWWSIFKISEAPTWFSICFKAAINLFASLFVLLLHDVYSARLLSVLESPFLRRADWRSLSCNLTCDKTSLVEPQISKSLIDWSSNSLTHFSCLVG